jgi:hypothetical protein
MNSHCNLLPRCVSLLRHGAPSVISSIPLPAFAGSLHHGQGRRASISIALNLREGSAYLAGSPSRRRFFDIAHASAFEVEAVLDIARICGFDSVADRAASVLAGRVAAHCASSPSVTALRPVAREPSTECRVGPAILQTLPRTPNGLNAVARRGRTRQIEAHARSAGSVVDLREERASQRTHRGDWC